MGLGWGEQSLSSTPLKRSVGVMKTFSTFFPHKTLTFFPSIFQFPKLSHLINLCIKSVFTCAVEVGFGHITSHVTTARAEPQADKQTNTQTDLILCSLERSGLRLVNFWASFQTVMMKKKTLRMMMRHTGPKKLQMRPSSRDSQQLVRRKETHVHA